MKKSFRQSMAWLHTWTGLVASWVMYFVFITGTTGYFRVEINSWMEPEQNLTVQDWSLSPSKMLAKADAYLRKVALNAEEWQVILPVGRYSTDLRVSWVAGSGEENTQQSSSLVYDLNTGSFGPEQSRDTGGGNALYLMHERLHYLPRSVGEFIVFLCSIVMLLTILSGIITHKKILLDFFSFRRGIGQRAWLDAHNLAGVLTLPFLLAMTYSGLVFSTYSFFMDSYNPAPVQALYSDETDYFSESIESSINGPLPDNVRAPMLLLSPFLDKAKQYWEPETDISFIRVLQPGDVTAEIHLWQAENRHLLREGFEQLHFSVVDGELIRQQTATESRSRIIQSTLYGLHEGIFAGPILRWLYFGSGLLGCITIASGLVLWTVKRRRRQEQNGKPGFRLVEILNVGTIAGLLVGVAVYFWVNRLLPIGMENRADWEMHCLFIAWGTTFIYAALRPSTRAWVDIFSAGAALYVFLPVLNALTTGRHLGVTLLAGDWVLAGFDLTVFVFGMTLAMIAWKVHRRNALQQLSEQAAAVKAPALASSSGDVR